MSRFPKPLYDESGLRRCSELFRNGGNQFKKLRERDQERDPEWVIIPNEKGILRINLEDNQVQGGETYEEC